MVTNSVPIISILAFPQNMRGELRKTQQKVQEAEGGKQRLEQELKAEQEARRKVTETADGLRTELDASRTKAAVADEEKLQ